MLPGEEYGHLEVDWRNAEEDVVIWEDFWSLVWSLKATPKL